MKKKNKNKGIILIKEGLNIYSLKYKTKNSYISLKDFIKSFMYYPVYIVNFLKIKSILTNYNFFIFYFCYKTVKNWYFTVTKCNIGYKINSIMEIINLKLDKIKNFKISIKDNITNKKKNKITIPPPKYHYKSLFEFSTPYFFRTEEIDNDYFSDQVLSDIETDCLEDSEFGSEKEEETTEKRVRFSDKIIVHYISRDSSRACSLDKSYTMI